MKRLLNTLRALGQERTVFPSNTVKWSGIHAPQVPGYVLCVVTMSDVTGPDGPLGGKEAASFCHRGGQEAFVFLQPAFSLRYEQMYLTLNKARDFL